jgi:hypothetical protein
MVQVTNSPEGLTFIDYSWVARLNGRSYTSHTSPNEIGRPYSCYIGKGEVVTEVQTPHVVPNGKWVAGGFGLPVGLERHELEELEYHDKDGRYHRLVVGYKPFGLVGTDPEGRKTLVYSRQVWKGELGRGVRIPTLDYVRQPLASHRGLGMKARERRRGQYGWVKLADLGEMSGCGYRPDKEVELILDYWQFSGHRNYRYYENNQDGGQLIDVAWGSRLDIETGNAEFKSLTREQFREECSDTSEVWVRRGFAYTILRLHALGVQPEVMQPA